MPRCWSSSANWKPPDERSPELLDLVCYERDRGFVLGRFREGVFDYIDAASEVFETDFFRFIAAKRYLLELAQSYPSPREKEEVPTWFYIASNISLRLHGVHGFHSYPYVVRCGGMLGAFGPEVARKTTHPQSGDVTLVCSGFNDKNEYDRQTPCDQDYLRKLSRDTEPEALESWFNGEVARLFKRHKLFDQQAGVWVGDASYVFVPDNDAYERSARMLFDEHGHPVESAKVSQMAPEAAARCQWRRCYKLVSLLYVDRPRDFFLRVAMRLVPGNEHECPIFYAMLENFVADVGEGVVRRLLLDRGFIDGERIAHCKLKLGIDVLIPVRRDMDIYHDVLGLLKLKTAKAKFREYQPPKREPVDEARLPHSPEPVRKRELKRQKTVQAQKAELPPPPPHEVLLRSEVAGFENLRTFTTCSVPLNVIVNRDVFADGHTQLWMLLDTKPLTPASGPAVRRAEYAIRTDIEEGHRQLKCFWDLTRFTSRAFSLVLNQIVFVLLAYNLLQVFLRDQRKPPLSRRSRPRQLDLAMTTAAVIIIYVDNRFATLTPLEYTELLLTLGEEARKRVLNKTRRMREELGQALRIARSP
jgi:hypothetical protein